MLQNIIVSSFVLLEAILCLWHLAASPCTPGLLRACVRVCMRACVRACLQAAER